MDSILDKVMRYATLVLSLTAAFLLCLSHGNQFNYEVEKRILERLDFYLNGPTEVNKLISNIRANGGFPHDLEAKDRDQYLTIAYSVSQPLVYYALEDGTISGYYWANGYYREPGNSGYYMDNQAMQKHARSCIDKETGTPIECILEPGMQYVSCEDGLGDETGLCEVIEPCPSQPECDVPGQECLASKKWCRQYSLKTAPTTSSKIEPTPLGYVPLTNFCINHKGHFSQEPGMIIDPMGEARETQFGSCIYGNGDIVQRFTAGNYAACHSEECDTVFMGGFESNEYDPRYRPWYIKTKELQKPNWLPPYPFFTLGIGVTYAAPIYSVEEGTGRQIFAGVLAVDYRFEDINHFVVDSYGNSSTYVLIFEEAEPHYLISSSTGSDTAKFFLTEDLSTPCPYGRGDDVPCTPVRTSLQELEGHPKDKVLVNAATKHMLEGYPEDLLVSKADPTDVCSPLFVSQSTLYIQDGAELAWRVVVVTPGSVSTVDSITLGEPLFSVICVIATVGVLIGCYFLWMMYARRREKAIIYADWRFTSVFVSGCILLNGSSFTLLGENTDTTCLLRMWMFHLIFAMTLVPLFVKIWRIYKLMGPNSFRKNNVITNRIAALYCLPMILVQIVILLVFTFVDAPKQTEVIENEEGMVVQRITCDRNTEAFFIVQGIFEAGLVFIGCFLAFLTRNMQDDFGEAKQLLLSMYNIAFVGIIVVIVDQVANLDGQGQKIMQAVGVFWGTVCSAGIFVIPRLTQANDMKKRKSESSMISQISGLSMSSMSILTASQLPSVMPSVLESIQESNCEGEEGEMEDRCSATMPMETSSEQATPTSVPSRRVDWVGMQTLTPQNLDFTEQQ